MSDIVAGWRVWVDDGAGGIARYNSRDHQWSDFPVSTMVVTMLYFDNGTRRVMSGSEYYWRLYDGLVGIDHWKQGDFEPTDADAVVKLGKLVADVVFEEALNEAMAMQDAP